MTFKIFKRNFVLCHLKILKQAQGTKDLLEKMIHKCHRPTELYLIRKAKSHHNSQK